MSANRPMTAECPHSIDVALMTRVDARDEHAVRELARRILPRIRRTVRALIRNCVDVDDVVQLCVLAVLRSSGSYRGEAPLERWMTRIIVRKVADFLNNERRSRSLLDQNAELSELPAPEPESFVPELARPMEDYLDNLPEAQRMAIVMRYGLGYTVGEVADATGVSIETVRSRIRVGRKKLQRLLRRDLSIGPPSRREP